MADADLTPLSADEQQAFQGALASDSLSMAPSEISVGGTKDAFCESWPMVKNFLNVIKNVPIVPQRIRDAIPKVIEWGDSIYGTVCPTR